MTPSVFGEPDGNGTISPARANPAFAGEPATLTLLPAAGFEAVEIGGAWPGGIAGVADGK